MDQDLLERIIASPRLPSMPAVALEIIALVQDPDVAVDRLAATIANDPALAAKILKTVNSSFYAQARTIASIDQAIVVMGLNSVRILALGFSLTDNLRKDAHDTANFDHNYFWQRSILSATTSRSVAARFSAGQGDEAFLAGLLDQLGVLTMHETIGDAYDRAGAGAWGDGAMLIAHEEEAFDLNHAVVGHALADSWSLPQRLTTCLRWYTNPDGADPEDLALVRVVAIADFVATVFLGPNPGDALQSLQRAAAQWYDLSPASVEDLITYVRNETDEMGNLFDLPADDIPAAAEILTRANAGLTEITLQAAQQTTLLEHRNRELASLAATDSLTGVANRRGFDDFLAQQARISARYRGPLSLLLADLDHFKQVNDQQGHLAGDEVLRRVAAVLRETAREADVVARYGGEEFGLILPDTALPGALALANRLRAAVEELRVPLPGGPTLAITISIGVATCNLDQLRGAEGLVADADAGLYAAKQAGRNRVMVRRADAA